MLSSAVNLTTQYAQRTMQSERKVIGQFFTCESTAVFMAELLHAQKESVRILDPGAGSGILSTALICALIKKDIVKKITLDIYETDDNVTSILLENLTAIKKYCIDNEVKLVVSVKKENYIIGNEMDWKDSSFSGRYDLIICNPPYKKISAASPEAQVMKDIVHGQPNLYFLFMAMSLKHLVADGELSFIIPRSWAAGAYFRKFREFLFANGNIQQIHIFKSRNKVFQNENVLQETIIIHVRKGKQGKFIKVSESNTSSKFSDLTEILIPTAACISPSKILFLPSSQSEIDVIAKINTFDNSLKNMGLTARTGKVVDFRNKEYLKEKPDSTTVPLLWSSNFFDGRILHPFGKEVQFVSKKNHAILIKNGNYLFIKRFSSKEEPKRLQAAIYLHDLNTDYLAAENHLNYIDCSQMEPDTVWGLYAILSSRLWDSYIRLYNGSTQINAGDINELPMPSEEKLDKIGKLYLTDRSQLDKIVLEVLQ